LYAVVPGALSTVGASLTPVTVMPLVARFESAVPSLTLNSTVLEVLGLSLLVDGSDEVGRALTHLSGTAIASTVFTAIGASLLGYGIFNSLLARYPASAVVPFVLLVPIVGIATAWIVQDEVPSGLELIGGAVMLAGVAAATITSWRGKRRPAMRAGQISPSSKADLALPTR
jgi:O-acetylserine/cysteine efflux transporter